MLLICSILLPPHPYGYISIIQLFQINFNAFLSEFTGKIHTDSMVGYKALDTARGDGKILKGFIAIYIVKLKPLLKLHLKPLFKPHLNTLEF